MFPSPTCTVIALLACLQTQWRVTAVDHQHQAGVSPLRGGRSMIETYKCNLCADPKSEFQSVPHTLAKRVVTISLLGDHLCKRLYDAALAGGVIRSQNQCNSVKAEFGPVCYNAHSGSVEGDPLTTASSWPNRYYVPNIGSPHQYSCSYFQ